MAQVLVVTSGKGGVGKTTSTAALGAALAHDGTKVVVIDFDVGLRNLDLVMGAERRVVFDLINVINGVAKLPQALIRDKRLESLHLLPASQTRDKDALTEDAKVIDELREKFDWIICDSPAGIERGATLAMRYADAAIIVTNPEVSSVRDSDRIIGLLDSKTVKAERGERIDGLLISQDHPSERRPIYSPFAKPRPSGRYCRRNRLGSLKMFTAMRRASSLVRRFMLLRRLGTCLSFRGAPPAAACRPPSDPESVCPGSARRLRMSDPRQTPL